MRLPYYHVDAFTPRRFGGNPAGVCPLEHWLPDIILQSIAAENNLAETAFFVRHEEHFHLRWFTPEVEVELCGHATLASAFVLFSELGYAGNSIRFHSLSGALQAIRRSEHGRIELDFPSRPPTPVADAPDALLRGLGAKPRALLKSRDWFAVYDSPEEVAALAPDFGLLGQVPDCVGIIATARGGLPGTDADFVSRFFAPAAGIPEDPVTGSAHCTLIPYWAEQLGRTEFFARQISARGGELFCRLDGERVGIAGQAVIYARGELEIEG